MPLNRRLTRDLLIPLSHGWTQLSFCDSHNWIYLGIILKYLAGNVWHFIHQWHLNWLFPLPSFRAHWFVHSWTLCALSQAVTVDVFPMPLLYWQMNMAEKLSRKSNSSRVTTIPALIFHIHWGWKGENLTAFPALRDRPTWLWCVELTFLLSPTQDGYMQKSVTALYTALWTSLYVGETDIKIE